MSPAYQRHESDSVVGRAGAVCGIHN